MKRLLLNRYHDVFPIDKVTAEENFASGDVEKICQTMVAVTLHEND